MKEFIGKNNYFKVIWDFHTQAYYVYYKEKYLGVKKYSFRDIQSYLD